MGKGGRIQGKSYSARVRDVNRIYEEHINSGLSNREILRRYIYPIYPISESTFYNMLKAEYRDCAPPKDNDVLSLFPDEDENQ